MMPLEDALAAACEVELSAAGPCCRHLVQVIQRLVSAVRDEQALQDAFAPSVDDHLAQLQEATADIDRALKRATAVLDTSTRLASLLKNTIVISGIQTPREGWDRKVDCND